MPPDHKYLARVYREKVLRKQIRQDVEVMIRSLLCEEQVLRIEKLNPHGKFCPPHHWAVRMNQWFASGETETQALCNFLGAIVEGCWFPKT